MATGWARSRAILASLALAGTALTALPGTAAAQEDARLRKLEAEVRALQRQVFPGADGKYFTPEITPATPAPSQPAGTPSTSAVTDILSRLDAVESQLSRLTAATEINANAMVRLEERIDALEARPVAPASPVEQPSGVIPVPGTSAARGAATPPAAAQAPARPAAPSAERLARVQAIAKPDTGDAGDDEYTYGFRLWEAGLFPEAQQQLKLFLDRYPSHARATFGRNLLGRAYLDDGKPKEAAVYFLQNYQADKQAARGPDSLLFLAETMIAMNDTSRACIALAEFGDTYPGLATGRLRDQYEANRTKVTCTR
ncbi:tetratricopeptide repeat protein [Altericroceibacterium xinjiangense]|uniref:tetratricopeptide repeat protein n=1 Tax=Altericroceibacterium xinjiangense TaxID=762261 RepID=UPI000F7F9DD0|nr:tetratricopeptide repeat protein [Altericroceibacterium xinjiangense]